MDAGIINITLTFNCDNENINSVRAEIERRILAEFITIEEMDGVRFELKSIS